MQNWMCNYCCACIETGGLLLMEACKCLWVDSRERMATDSMWLVKQSQILYSRNPNPNQNRTFHGESGFFGPQLLCLD